MQLDIAKKFLKDNFFQNLTMTFSASFAARIFTAFNFIILARIYDQNVIGDYSIFIAYISIIVAFALGSYELILPNLKEIEDISVLTILLFTYSSMVGFLVSIVSFIFGYNTWLFLGLACFANLIIIISDKIMIRFQKFTILSIMNFAIPVLFCIIFLIVSRFSGSIMGLAGGQAIAFILIAGVYVYKSYKLISTDFKMRFRWKNIKFFLITYRDFPLFVAPSQLFNALSLQLPVILIGHFINVTSAAQYSLALRFCIAPVNILSKAIYQVYYGKITSGIRTGLRDYYSFFKLLSCLLFISGISLGLTIYYIYPMIIDLLFGEEWFFSSLIAKSLAPLCAATVCVLPLTAAFLAFNDQKFLLKNQTWNLLITVFSFAYGILVHNLIFGIIVFSILTIVRNLFVWLRLKKLHKVS